MTWAARALASRMTSLSPSLQLARDGAELAAKALDSSALATLDRVLADQPRDVAGVRLFGLQLLQPLLAASGSIGAIAVARLGEDAQPVRAILFDKTPSANWSLAWHQDRVVAVRKQVDLQSFGPWTRKHGALHVAPPFQVLARMLTLRVHLDAVSENNAPLLVAPGSHRRGRIAEAKIPDVVAQCGVSVCIAAPGDVWVYSTPILHASECAKAASSRRVLQVDYASDGLPGGLEWLGV